jgi:hypothetical protein
LIFCGTSALWRYKNINFKKQSGVGCVDFKHRAIVDCRQVLELSLNSTCFGTDIAVRRFHEHSNECLKAHKEPEDMPRR